MKHVVFKLGVVLYPRVIVNSFDSRPRQLRINNRVEFYCIKVDLLFRLLKPGFHYPSLRPELTARVDDDRFPLPVNTGRVDGRAFSLAELTDRQHGPSTRVVETGL